MSFTTVAVTGATGFIGAHIATQLLDRGYIVHATLRDNTPSRVAHLISHPKASTNLRLFEADLQVVGSFDPAFAGCDAVIHVASPFTLHAADPLRDVVQPAVDGTRNVLQAAAEAGGVRKVVLTSSFAAIQNSKARIDEEFLHTEADWNDEATLKTSPYSYSKLAAERAAWEFVGGGGHDSDGDDGTAAKKEEKEKDKPFDLVVINPVAVFGPALSASGARCESLQSLVDVVHGKYFGILDISFTIVDVRDVAHAHVVALESATASGRYICSAQSGKDVTYIRDFSDAARRKGYDPPTRDLTAGWVGMVLKVLSYVMPGQTGHMVRGHIGVRHQCSNEKIVRELGMKFRTPEETLAETFDTLVKWGCLPDGDTGDGTKEGKKKGEKTC